MSTYQSLLQKFSTYRKYSFSLFAFFLFILLAILKLFLVSNEEIVALDASYDDLWYIRSAAHWVWFAGDYNFMTLIHLPVYALYIALIHLTGIPLRIGTELTFLASGFFFVYALRKIGLSQLFSLLAYALIILNPASFIIFNRSLAQNLYVSLLLLSLAGIILMFANIKTKKFLPYSIISGLFLALSFLTREEGTIALGIIFIIALLISVPFYLRTRDWKTTKRRLKIGVLVPIGIIFLFSLTIRTANYFKFGLFATSELNASSYKKAYSALLRIKPEKTIRYVPITTDARKKAYLISPSFRELEPYLENRSNLAFGATKMHMRIENEMAAGWFYWTLREAVNSAGHKSAKDESDFYESIASEIDRAINEKKIPGRTVPVSFIDPATFSFLPSHGFASFGKIWEVMINTKKTPKDHANLFSGEALESLNLMANRRIALIETKAYSTDDESIFQESGETGFKQRMKDFAWLVYGNTVSFLTFLDFFLLAILLVRRKKIDLEKPVYPVLIVLFFTFFFHLFLLILLDVNSWPGNNSGYLFPVMPIFSTFLIFFAFQSFKNISKRPNNQ